MDQPLIQDRKRGLFLFCLFFISIFSLFFLMPGNLLASKGHVRTLQKSSHITTCHLAEVALDGDRVTAWLKFEEGDTDTQKCRSLSEGLSIPFSQSTWLSHLHVRTDKKKTPCQLISALRGGCIIVLTNTSVIYPL